MNLVRHVSGLFPRSEPSINAKVQNRSQPNLQNKAFCTKKLRRALPVGSTNAFPHATLTISFYTEANHKLQARRNVSYNFNVVFLCQRELGAPTMLEQARKAVCQI